MVHPVNMGKRTRMSFARIEEALAVPDLIEVQKNSYQWFLDEGIREMFKDISPIEDNNGNLALEFVGYSLGEPKYSVLEAKERDANYAAPLRVKVRLHIKDEETHAIKEVKENGTTSRDLARRESGCTLAQVTKVAGRLLKYGGRFCMCHRPERLADVIFEMRKNKIEPKRLTFVNNATDSAEPWLILIEGKKGGHAGLKINYIQNGR